MLIRKLELIIGNVLVAGIPLAGPRDKLVEVSTDASLSAGPLVHVAGRAGGEEEVVCLAHGVGAEVVEAVESVLRGRGARQAVVQLVHRAVDGDDAVQLVEGRDQVQSLTVVPGEWLRLA